MRCKARSKQSGDQCKKDAVPGTSVCHIHGGKSLKGMDSPRFKDGSRSRYYPRGNLVELYNEAHDGGAYTDQREEIALTTGMINEVLSEQGEAIGTLCTVLRRTWVEAEQACDAGDRPKVAAKLEVVGRLIKDGAAAAARRDEAVGLMDHRRKLVDSETRRLERERQTLTLEQVMMRDMVIMEVLKEMLDDGQLARIRSRLRERMGR